MTNLLHKNPRSVLMAVLLSFAAGGCAGNQPPIEPVAYVDLDRFMGDWYVIANIPTFLEKGAHNAVESYAMNDDGTIATTFVFRKDSFDGKKKTYNPKAFVTDTQSNAVWGMRFIWPVKADYRIVYLDENYSRTVIARNKRDYVWIMARTPSISNGDYEELVSLIESLGYDTEQLRKVPQQW
jgi:apolipoprotein D and lipocalin family protein